MILFSVQTSFLRYISSAFEKRYNELVADGNLLWVDLLQRFYTDFEPKVKVAFDNMEKKAPVMTGEFCPKCSSPLVVKRSKYGEFIACSNYPECKYIKNEKEEVKDAINYIASAVGTRVNADEVFDTMFQYCSEGFVVVP